MRNLLWRSPIYSVWKKIAERANKVLLIHEIPRVQSIGAGIASSAVSFSNCSPDSTLIVRSILSGCCYCWSHTLKPQSSRLDDAINTAFLQTSLKFDYKLSKRSRTLCFALIRFTKRGLSRQ